MIKNSDKKLIKLIKIEKLCKIALKLILSRT